MGKAPRVLLVGWDAADWKMINPLMDAGHMPALKGLVERGVCGNLATLSPVLSPMLWSSIATGKRPFKHGVAGFTEPTPDGKAVRPVTSMSRTARAVWNILTLEGLKSHVVGWWPSHPAEPINGAMVSNRYQRAPRGRQADWKMAPGTVHPERLADILAELRVHPSEIGEEHLRLFVPQGDQIDQASDRRIDSLIRVIADCSSIQSAATYLIEEEPWDFAAVYFDAIDHFGHGFMKYHPPRRGFVPEKDFELYRHVMSAGYVYHDLMLARLLELAGEDTVVMLVSDHGFHPDHLRPEAIPLEPAGPATEHRDQGIFVMAGPGIRKDAAITGASLLDIAPTLLTLFGLPVGEDMDGRPLAAAFETAPEIRSIPSWEDVPGDAGRHAGDAAEDPDAARETLKQLVDLGYIERPDDDAGKAVAQTVREQHYNLALAYMDAGMHPKAAELLAGIYREQPLEFRYGIRLAICLQAMGQAEAMNEVLEHLRATWARAAEEASARLREIATLGRSRRSAAPEAEGPEEGDLFSPAEHQVIRALRSISRGNPRTLDLLSASVATARGAHDAALGHLDSARVGGSATPGFHVQLGAAYLDRGRLGEARESFERVLELDAENPNAHLGLCRVALKEGRDEAALAHARRATGLKYQLAAGHFYLGRALARTGALDEAIPALERALAMNPNFPEAHAMLAHIHGRVLKDLVRAADHRRLARLIREERRAAMAARPALSLPPLAEIDVEAELPAWPEPPAHVLPPLAAPPKARPAGLAPAGPGFVTVVSGLPRSGTSMAMQMLAAGGLAAMTDAARAADANNPKGYLEHDRVRRLASENDWLDEARGKALKVVAPLIPALPQHCDYRVIMMRRDTGEILDSQARMLGRLERAGGALDRAALQAELERQIEMALRLLRGHKVPVLELSHAAVIADPVAAAAAMARHLGLDLDPRAMAATVDPALWRERALPG
ncbi:alkaline phosphatase family protein [Poseidonocella sp. HB161398]|uniref:alkaline phosphatase family protein n=1 Tax=Poseidonocella sp. HB161398 TaxID=2320855 RepID=UPI001108DC44|nr:alkaline phosphatase family protein [Poseidonocella sp. HB161398]